MNPDDRDGMLRYDELSARVYTERRMPTGTRDLILALGWVTLRDPRRHNPDHGIWARAREVLNVDNARMWKRLKEDAPRYEHDWHADAKGCQAPMVRIDRLCGRNTMDGFTEADLATGRFRMWGFCTRPRCQAYAKGIYERAQRSNAAAPDPIPNVGGLLPLFFSWDWEAKYTKADQSWTVPVYGLSADEWPAVAGEEPVHAFPKLRLAASDGDVVVVKSDAPTLVTADATRALAARSNLLAEMRRNQFSVVNLPRQTSPSKGDQVT